MALAIYTAAAWTANGGIEVSGGASVEVRDESSGSLASLFSDREGETGIDNPLTADAQGRFAFFVSGGAYRITVTQGGDEYELEYQAVGTAAERDANSSGDVLATGNLANGSGSGVAQVDQEEEISESWSWRSQGTGPSSPMIRFAASPDQPDGLTISTRGSPPNRSLAFYINESADGPGSFEFRSHDDDSNFSNLLRIYPGGGLEVGSPSGGDEGFGTLNAEELNENGNRVGPIESAIFEIGGSGSDFAAGSDVALHRIGESATMTTMFDLFHDELSTVINNVSTSSTLLPSVFRPGEDTTSVVNASPGRLASCRIGRQGQIRIKHFDNNLSLAPQTEVEAFSMAYNIV